ncbi:MAG: motility associated factor glycosyltransferase family protein [Spirochaetota bacterium]
MKDVLQKNIAFLSRYYPSIIPRLIQTPRSAIVKGECTPNIYLNRRAFHSVSNPDREAENMVNQLNVKPGYLFIFMGIGMGYHIRKFRKLYSKNIDRITLVAIEKSMEAFSLMVQNTDISFLEGVDLFIDQPPERITQYFDGLEPENLRGFRIIKLRGAYNQFRSYYNYLEETFKIIASQKLSGVLTRHAFEKLWMKNIVKNIPHLVNKHPINVLKGSLSGAPALVLGAGHSLHRQLRTIKTIASNTYIIAADTALEPLLKSEITPDFVVSLDSQFHNLDDFHLVFTADSPPPDTTLIADITAYPEILKNWKGRVFFSRTELQSAGGDKRGPYPLLEKLFREYFAFDSLLCGGSVITTALEFALYAGAAPVVVAGLDLSYTNYSTHLNSSPAYNRFFRAATRLNSLESMMVSSIRKRELQYLPGTGGQKVLSDFVFNNYLAWISQRKPYQDNVINATINGARIPNLGHCRLEELIHRGYFKAPKPTFLLNPTPVLGPRSCLQFLGSLELEVENALNELESAAATQNYHIIADCIARYPSLENIIREALVIYPDPLRRCTYLMVFLNFLRKQIGCSIKRLDQRDG